MHLRVAGIKSKPLLAFSYLSFFSFGSFFGFSSLLNWPRSSLRRFSSRFSTRSRMIFISDSSSRSGGILANDPVDPVKYAAAKDGVLDLILQESDKRLAAQVQLMLAADSRATAVLSASIVLAAAGIGYAISKLEAPTPLFWGAIVFGVIEALAALSALWALTPQSVDPQGWAPKTFATDLQKPKSQVQAEMAKYLQSRIDKNRTTASKLAQRIRAALMLAALGPLAGLEASLIAANEVAFALITFVLIVGYGSVAISSFHRNSVI